MIRANLYTRIGKKGMSVKDFQNAPENQTFERGWILEVGNQPMKDYLISELFHWADHVTFRKFPWRRIDQMSSWLHRNVWCADGDCMADAHITHFPPTVWVDLKCYDLSRKNFEKVADFDITEEQHKQLSHIKNE